MSYTVLEMMFIVFIVVPVFTIAMLVFGILVFTFYAFIIAKVMDLLERMFIKMGVMD